MKYIYKTVVILKNSEQHVTHSESDEPYRPWQLQNEVFKIVMDTKNHEIIYKETEIESARVFQNDELVYDHHPYMKAHREFLKREKEQDEKENISPKFKK